jgi:hypothetical protein
MGTWGINLYQDDVALDVRDEYLNRLRIGMNNKGATDAILNSYESENENDEDTVIMYLALADTQSKYGRLLPQIKKQALKYINNNIDLERWIEDKKKYEKRKKVLDELKERLETKQLVEKPISKLTFARSSWDKGDLLFYQILNEEEKDRKWHGKYVLLRVVEIKKFSKGSLPIDEYYDEMPIISLYNWVGDMIPKIELVNKLNFILLENYFDTLFGKIEKHIGIVSFSKKDLKKLNIQVISKEQYSIKINEDMNRNIVIYSINNFDSTITNALKMAEKQGTLIMEDSLRI